MQFKNYSIFLIRQNLLKGFNFYMFRNWYFFDKFKPLNRNLTVNQNYTSKPVIKLYFKSMN